MLSPGRAKTGTCERGLRSIGVGDEVKKLQERWYSLCLAPRREHVMCKMVHVLLPPVVLPGECHVTKGAREKNPVGTTVGTQHPTSMGERRHILLPPQPFFVLRNYILHVINHISLGTTRAIEYTCTRNDS